MAELINMPKLGFDMAEGVLGQHIFVIPSKGLVIVKVAQQKQSHVDVVKFLELVIKSIDS